MLNKFYSKVRARGCRQEEGFEKCGGDPVRSEVFVTTRRDFVVPTLLIDSSSFSSRSAIFIRRLLARHIDCRTVAPDGVGRLSLVEAMVPLGLSRLFGTWAGGTLGDSSPK